MLEGKVIAKKKTKYWCEKKFPLKNGKKKVYDNKVVKDVVCHLLDGVNLGIPVSICLTFILSNLCAIGFCLGGRISSSFFNPFLFLLFKCSNLRPLFIPPAMHRSNLQRKKGKNIRHAILSRLNTLLGGWGGGGGHKERKKSKG